MTLYSADAANPTENQQQLRAAFSTFQLTVFTLWRLHLLGCEPEANLKHAGGIILPI